MQFEMPVFLLLLILVPLIIWLGWPSNSANHQREALNLLLRVISVVCLIFALAGFDLVRPSNDLGVVFLMDVSDSIAPATQTAELNFVRNALKNMGRNDQAAVVVFGGNALVERSMSSEKVMSNISSTPDKGETNLEDAIRLGISLYPPQSARRMVILTDGANTQGDAIAAAKLAAGLGIQMETIATGGNSSAEAMITGMDMPRHLQEGEHFDLNINLYASQSMPGNIRVLEDDRVVFTGTQKLESGDQSFSLPLTADKTGFSRFQVQLDPQKDTFYQNNLLTTFTQITGIPRILLAAQKAVAGSTNGATTAIDEAAVLDQALLSAKLTVERIEPGAIPSSVAGLAGYSAVVLVDVPASSLSQTQMQALQGYVRDLGGGLVVVGGSNSYGIGGYYQTPLEDMLPVSMQIISDTRSPTLSMVFVIDRSGSMDEIINGQSKLELTKEATLHAIDMLSAEDRVGVIAFDDTAAWIVPMTDLSNLQNVKNAVEGIHSGSGTNILSGIQAMSTALANDPAKNKLAILLTDGAGDPAGLTDMVQQLHETHGIILSTIGIGNQAAAYLPQLAKLGGGRSYFTSDAGHIPDLFSKETALASQPYLIEHRFVPVQANPSAILTGIDVKSMPALLGYVGTTAKDNSQKILISDIGDPILSTWQYGLGRTAAFTSDASGHWAQEWLNWGSFGGFWTQLTRFTTREQTPSLLETRVQQGQGGQSTLIVDGQTEKGDLLNGFHIQAHITAADGSTQVVTLNQTAPGQYSAAFDTLQPGGYLISVQGTAPQGSAIPAVSAISGWVVPYSAEYRHLAGDSHLLEQITALGNGKTTGMDDGSAKSVFSHDLAGGQVNLPTWAWLVGTALILLPLDIALRRLLIRPGDVKNNLMRRLGLQQLKVERVHFSRIDALMKVKQGLGKRYQKQAQPRVIGKSAPTSVKAPIQKSEAPTATPQRAAPKIPTKTAASLLAAKRGREKE